MLIYSDLKESARLEKKLVVPVVFKKCAEVGTGISASWVYIHLTWQARLPVVVISEDNLVIHSVSLADSRGSSNTESYSELVR
jgi:hypothetical protein